MSKINCSLIKDLLPLYIDDLCSKESTEVIKNHLEVCEECNKEHETLKSEPKIKPQQDNSQELIKKVNKRFGKEKKKAVLKTLSVILVVLILIGAFAFLKVPLYMAESDYHSSITFYPSNYEDWEICNNSKKNFEHKSVDLYINKSLGEYEVVEKDSLLILEFSDNRMISVSSFYLDEIPEFTEKSGVFFKATVDVYPFLTSVIKRGVENLGISTEVELGYNYEFQRMLIKATRPEVKLFSSYDDYATACAFYGCYNRFMPVLVGNEYYLLGESESFVSWGMSAFFEDHSNYVMHYQSKEDLKKTCTVQVLGFTKEEAQEILKYAVVK